MHHDALSTAILQLLQLRWTASGRTHQPDGAMFHELRTCVDIDQDLLVHIIADLIEAGFVERVQGEYGAAGRIAYSITDIGRHVVIADRRARRRLRFDA